jgi:putative endonuclease
MFCVLAMALLYILQSETTHRFYIGSTNDLARRLEEHGRGHSLATRGRGPWKLVYQEQFESLADARRRELEIKRWKSARLVASLVSTTAS